MIGPKYFHEEDLRVLREVALPLENKIEELIERESKSGWTRLEKKQLEVARLALCCRLLAMTTVHDPYGQELSDGVDMYIKEHDQPHFTYSAVHFSNGFIEPQRTTVPITSLPERKGDSNIYIIQNPSKIVDAERMANYVAIELQKRYWARNPLEFVRVVVQR